MAKSAFNRLFNTMASKQAVGRKKSKGKPAASKAPAMPRGEKAEKYGEKC